jgi:TetR/AcrR family transcriptional repressor of nem operon
MVQKSSGTAPKGRPLAFQRDTVLDAAMRLFWAKGFERTSLEDLEKRTGLSRSSLYNTFGSKRELFEQALTWYLEMLDRQLLGPLESGTEGLADVRRFIDRLASQLAPGSIAGCLLTNSLAEFGGKDGRVVRQGQDYLDRARGSISAALTRAAAFGEVDAASVEPRSELLLGLVLAINLVARSGVGERDLRPLVAAVHAEVDLWHLPS